LFRAFPVTNLLTMAGVVVPQQQQEQPNDNVSNNSKTRVVLTIEQCNAAAYLIMRHLAHGHPEFFAPHLVSSTQDTRLILHIILHVRNAPAGEKKVSLEGYDAAAAAIALATPIKQQQSESKQVGGGSANKVLRNVKLFFESAAAGDDTKSSSSATRLALPLLNITEEELLEETKEEEEDEVQEAKEEAKETKDTPGLLYAFGGSDSKSRQCLGSEAYAPAIKQWIKVAPMPSARYESCGALLPANGKLYMCGGCDGRVSLTSVVAYDTRAITQHKWTACAPMKVARRAAACAAYANTVFVMGGQDGPQTFLRSLECYDPIADRWVLLPSMAVARQGCVAACVGSIIYCCGGYNDLAGFEQANTVEMYNVNAKTWTTSAAKLATPRSGAGIAVVGTRVYVCGGFDGKDVVASMEMLDTAKQPHRWVSLRAMPVGRHEFGMSVLDGLLYVAGGENNAQQFLASAHVYSPADNTWREVAPMSTERNAPTLIGY
jgi:N-acetylneuraminic acid mutarotase